MLHLTIHQEPSAELRATLGRIEASLQALLLGEAKVAKEIDDLVAQVAANTTVEKSALTLIQGISGRIDAAVAAAQEAGASPAVLAQLAGLSVSLKSTDDELAAAIVANTPVVPA